MAETTVLKTADMETEKFYIGERTEWDDTKSKVVVWKSAKDEPEMNRIAYVSDIEQSIFTYYQAHNAEVDSSVVLEREVLPGELDGFIKE